MPVFVKRHFRHRRERRKTVLATHTVRETSYPEEHVLTAHVWRSGTPTVGALMPADILIGDDRYIFLGVESKHGFSDWTDIFVFDAIRLMRKGAQFRFFDIIESEAYRQFLSAMHDAETFYERETGEFPQWRGTSPETIALHRRLIEKDAGLKAAYKKVLARKDEITVGGERGIKLLREWYADPEGFAKRHGFRESSRPELLVPFNLALEESIGVVGAEAEES